MLKYIPICYHCSKSQTLSGVSYFPEKLQFPKSIRWTSAWFVPFPSYVNRMLDDQNRQWLYNQILLINVLSSQLHANHIIWISWNQWYRCERWIHHKKTRLKQQEESGHSKISQTLYLSPLEDSIWVGMSISEFCFILYSHPTDPNPKRTWSCILTNSNVSLHLLRRCSIPYNEKCTKYNTICASAKFHI